MEANSAGLRLAKVALAIPWGLLFILNWIRYTDDVLAASEAISRGILGSLTDERLSHGSLQRPLLM